MPFSLARVSIIPCPYIKYFNLSVVALAVVVISKNSGYLENASTTTNNLILNDAAVTKKNKDFLKNLFKRASFNAM